MPQHKKTHTVSAADLPDISPDRQEFVRLCLSGKTATEAYRTAFDCSSWSDRAVWTEASRLRNHPDILLWMEAARAAGLQSCVVSLDRHIRELERLKVSCERSGNYGAAVVCEQTIGKAAGLHIDRVQEVPIDPVQTLKDIAAAQPDVAAALAEQAGIPWTDIDPASRTLN